VGDTACPSPSVTPIAYAQRGAPVLVRSPQHTGVDAGRFRPVGNDAGLPPNQREEGARSARFEFEVPGGPGPRGAPGSASADVAADGSSTLVTRGALNLSAR
jgi:hypothetical protein